MPGVKLPEALLRSLRGVEGFDEDALERVHESGERVVSIRYNPAKATAKTIPHFEGGVPVPWSTCGYYLQSRPSFTLDPWLHAGAYYVQEASSMFLEQCLRQATDLKSPLKVLDLCAAPGGKSTLIQSQISHDSLLVSNEVIKTRVSVLTENIIKWGGANTVITNNDPKDFSRLKDYFDVMVIDAPCSGSGLFRKDPAAVNEWSLGSVAACSARQQRILADAYPALKQNGTLIYSTCSYSVEEDEEVCDWLCEKFDMEPLSIQTEKEWNITSSHSRKFGATGYRFFPDKLKGEGFFIAVFRKKDGGEDASHIKKHQLNRLSAKERLVVDSWLREPEALHLYHQGGSVLAFPAAMEPDLVKLTTSLYVKRAGLFCGKIAQRELIPDHDLALSGAVADTVPAIEVSREQALRYLRKEEMKIEGQSKGWMRVQYAGQDLGWIKQLINRTNNYYPKEWRILKSGNS